VVVVMGRRAARPCRWREGVLLAVLVVVVQQDWRRRLGAACALLQLLQSLLLLQLLAGLLGPADALVVVGKVGRRARLVEQPLAF
jgi:hypothetical protein